MCTASLSFRCAFEAFRSGQSRSFEVFLGRPYADEDQRAASRSRGSRRARGRERAAARECRASRRTTDARVKFCVGGAGIVQLLRLARLTRSTSRDRWVQLRVARGIRQHAGGRRARLPPSRHERGRPDEHAHRRALGSIPRVAGRHSSRARESHRSVERGASFAFRTHNPAARSTLWSTRI